ncbi:MAG: hypothetical protein IPN20_04475 [Haliscomenobacter sp.]|nr:hypothetical protein [Haliscomenobacter sp.]
MEETKKKGTAGRKPSGIEYTTLVLPEETRKSLREFADYLEKQTGEKFSLHRAISWLLTESGDPDEKPIQDFL